MSAPKRSPKGRKRGEAPHFRGSDWNDMDLLRYRIYRDTERPNDIIQFFPTKDDRRFVGCYGVEACIDGPILEDTLKHLSLDDKKLRDAPTEDHVRKRVKEPRAEAFFESLKRIMCDAAEKTHDSENRVEQLLREWSRLALNIRLDGLSNSGHPHHLRLRLNTERLPLKHDNPPLRSDNDGSVGMHLANSAPSLRILKQVFKASGVSEKLPVIQLEAKRSNNPVVPAQCAAELLVAVIQCIKDYRAVYRQYDYQFCHEHEDCQSLPCVAKTLTDNCKTMYGVFLAERVLTFTELFCSDEYLAWILKDRPTSSTPSSSGSSDAEDNEADDYDDDDDDDDFEDSNDGPLAPWKIYDWYDLTVEQQRLEASLVYASVIDHAEQLRAADLKNLIEKISSVDKNFGETARQARLKRTVSMVSLQSESDGPEQANAAQHGPRKIKTAHSKLHRVLDAQDLTDPRPRLPEEKVIATGGTIIIPGLGDYRWPEDDW